MNTFEFKTVRGAVAKFIADDAGATAIEYAVIAMMLSVAIVSSLYSVRDSLNGGFSFISTTFQTAL